MNILLLEDNAADADLTKRGIRNSIPDCNIDIAPTLKAARKFLQSDTAYDIGLLDMKLPDGIGLDLLIEIRGQELPMAVIILTGSGDENIAVTALKAGANDYVPKRQGYIEKLPQIISYSIENYLHSFSLKSEIIDVLYIEHHSSDIDLTIRHFRQYAPNIKIEAATSGEEAIEKIKRLKKPINYKVLLMDYRLPGITSLELIKIVRQELKLDLPIILVTGQGNEDIAVQSLKLGATNYLTKSENYLQQLPSVITNAAQRAELEKKQAALLESEAKYRLLAENSGDVIFVLDRDLNYTYISPAVKALRGFEPHEVITHNISEVLTPKSYKKALGLLSNALTTTLDTPGSQIGYNLVELEMIKKDKSTVWTEVKVSIIKDNKNSPTGLLGVTRDISKRKFAYNELRKLSQAVEQSPASIMITDLEGKLEYVNQKFTELTGYEFPEVVGQNPRLLKSGHTKLKDYNTLWNNITSGKEWRGELQNRHKSGSLYWEQASISPIRNEEGETTHFLGIKEDITERKKMTNQLILAKEKAEESDRMKTAFLSNMSHEIRTPMNGILGFLNLLNEPELNEEAKGQYITIINKSADRLLTTINDIIEISKIEAGEIKVEYSDIDVNEVLRQQYYFFSKQATDKGLRFCVSGEITDDAAIVKTDKYKVEGILINLIKNAIKFTTEGFIELGISRVKDSVEIYVKDSGRGIPKDRLDAIFDRFVQADIELTRDHEGSGLGLSIVKAYLNKLGGKIRVKSEVNKGTTFSFSIPYLEPSISLKKELLDTPIQISPPLNQINILIAEDDDSSYAYLSIILSKKGAQIIRTKNGKETVNEIKKNSTISLILMDIKMPIMDGVEATRQIRKFNKTIPIIAQTAYSFPAEKQVALKAGCTDYISKPINKAELIKLIDKYSSK